MKLDELNLPAGRSRKRVGRGTGSGHGKTAGRGTKGQKARTGKKLRPGFEGGQMPLTMRIPKKRGFTSVTEPTHELKIEILNRFKDGQTITVSELVNLKLLSKNARRAKIIAGGTLERKLVLAGITATKSAAEQITKKGGKFEKAEAKVRKAKSSKNG